MRFLGFEVVVGSSGLARRVTQSKLLSHMVVEAC